mmetsp:Transcript_8420/g.10446  ORF Transcript_8420/g.10446 Transcript_8420/m.10446 type:complete len:81 (+) Transcript_8420:119-361(+)
MLRLFLESIVVLPKSPDGECWDEPLDERKLASKFSGHTEAELILLGLWLAFERRLSSFETHSGLTPERLTTDDRRRDGQG